MKKFNTYFLALSLSSTMLYCQQRSLQISGSLSAGASIGHTLAYYTFHHDPSSDFREMMLYNCPLILNTILSKEAYEFNRYQNTNTWKPIPFYFSLGIIMGVGAHLRCLNKSFE